MATAAATGAATTATATATAAAVRPRPMEGWSARSRGRESHESVPSTLVFPSRDALAPRRGTCSLEQRGAGVQVRHRELQRLLGQQGGRLP